MNKKTGWGSGWSINDTSCLLDNKHYNKYYKKKLKINKRYDKRLFEFLNGNNKKGTEWYLESGQEEWRKYCKEVLDLMFQKEGDFQRFTWDIMSNNEVEVMERRARGRITPQNWY